MKQIRMAVTNSRVFGIVILAAGLSLSACHSIRPAGRSTGGGAAPSSMPGGKGHADQAMAMGQAATVSEWARGAMLFDGLGDFHRKVTTGSEMSQKYFDQGMRFLWAFNHDESTRSFAKAAEIDPQCAMCFWGVALTVGPNYNVPMMAEPRAKVAYEALQKAQPLAARATPVEQALIAALAKRYNGPQPLDPTNAGPVLTAYASAMKEVAQRFPEDDDVQTLYAEALMTTNAWKLWSIDGAPAPGTLEIEATLEAVLARNPRHPGANHYYIHTMEASPHPEKALPSAERLIGMMPKAGHLEHMPAHILQRVGRYGDAAKANEKGVAADLDYLRKTQPPDYYSMYIGHNYQFLAYSTAMEGRKADTLSAVRRFHDVVPQEMLAMMPGLDWYMTEVYSAMERFGLWDAILEEPAPDEQFHALRGGYYYARACALAEKGQVGDAKATLSRFEELAEATPADYGAGLNLAKDVFAVAIPVAKARIALAENDRDAAIGYLTSAVAKEDRLSYDEPADWFVPVRHKLGAELLKAGKASEAEAVYREDLRRHPNNGWALYGLAKSLAAQGKTSEAEDADRRFKEAWKNADVVMVASAF